MPNTGYREEVLNVELARLLAERGEVSLPETMFSLHERRNMPDVFLRFNGLAMVIEGKVDDNANAMPEVEQNARQRVDDGLAHIAVGLIYPASLRTVGDQRHLATALKTVVFRICVVTEVNVLPDKPVVWQMGNIDFLQSLFHRAFEELVKEDVVVRAVGVLEDGIAGFARAVLPHQAVLDRCAHTLGIGEPPNASHGRED
jgi:hypothetical protein